MDASLRLARAAFRFVVEPATPDSLFVSERMRRVALGSTASIAARYASLEFTRRMRAPRSVPAGCEMCGRIVVNPDRRGFARTHPRCPAPRHPAGPRPSTGVSLGYTHAPPPRPPDRQHAGVRDDAPTMLQPLATRPSAMACRAPGKR